VQSTFTSALPGDPVAENYVRQVWMFSRFLLERCMRRKCLADVPQYLPIFGLAGGKRLLLLCRADTNF
jgi:hypothetical protein